MVLPFIVKGTDPATTADALPDPDKPPTPEEIDSAELEKKIMLSTNNAALDEQFEQRPLAKKQEELQGAVVNEGSSNSSQGSDSKNKIDNETHTEDSSTSYQSEKPKQALLKNDDVELNRIGKVNFF
jgi:RNA polymerase II subunit A-like phosphatase